MEKCVYINKTKYTNALELMYDLDKNDITFSYILNSVDPFVASPILIMCNNSEGVILYTKGCKFTEASVAFKISYDAFKALQLTALICHDNKKYPTEVNVFCDAGSDGAICEILIEEKSNHD